MDQKIRLEKEVQGLFDVDVLAIGCGVAGRISGDFRSLSKQLGDYMELTP